MKKRITALLLCLVMVFSLIPTTVWAASNSTVVLHPSVGNTVTGVKVKVGDKIDGHAITSISGYDITVDTSASTMSTTILLGCPTQRISGRVLTTTKSTTSAGPEAAATVAAKVEVPCLPTARTRHTTISKAHPFC